MMTTTNNARLGLPLSLAIWIADTLAMSLAAKTSSHPTTPAQERPTMRHFATVAQALERVLATPAQVVAHVEHLVSSTQSAASHQNE